MTRKHSIEVTISEPISLADLRWLVGQCEDLDGGVEVTVKAHKEYNQIDCDPAEITVKSA